jgi:diaminopimelate decarboxylase
MKYIDAVTGWIGQLGKHALITPAYVISVDEIARQLRAVREAVGTPLVLSFSACPNADAQMRLPEDVRFGVRCSSKTEMSVVAPWCTEFSYVNLPSMDAPTMRAVLAGKFRLIADSADQLEMLASVRGKRVISPVTLGVNIGVIDRLTDAAKASNPADNDHLGMDMDELERALTLAQAHEIPVDGLQVFGGRHSFPNRSLALATVMRKLVAHVEARLGYALISVNLGGGLEEDWHARGHDFVAYRRALAEFPAHLQLMHDVGRSVTASAGCFVTTVVRTKAVHGRAVAICDGGMAQAYPLSAAAGEDRVTSTPLLRTSDGELRHVYSATGDTSTLIAGSSSSRRDLLGSIGARVVTGDILYFPNVGAYCLNRAPAGSAGLAPASVYVLQGGVAS